MLRNKSLLKARALGLLGGTGSAGDGSGVVINNQNKIVTENGSYNADSGYTGLGTVTVNVPIPDVDAAIAEELEAIENGTY